MTSFSIGPKQFRMVQNSFVLFKLFLEYPNSFRRFQIILVVFKPFKTDPKWYGPSKNKLDKGTVCSNGFYADI